MMLDNLSLFWGTLINPRNGYELWEDWRQRGSTESPKALPTTGKGLGKITWKQMWFDITTAETPPEQIDQQSSAVLGGL